MLPVVRGVYRSGKIELENPPAEAKEGADVIVMFLEDRKIDLRSLGITRQQAAEMRSRLASFAEEWDSPEMSIYDDYDSARANRQ